MNQRINPGTLRSATPAPGPAYLTRADERAIRAAVKAAFAGRKAETAPNPFRDEVLPRFERTRADYLALARRVALEAARRLRRPVTVDDVREVCPPPPQYDGRLMGAIFKTPDWIFVDYVRSGRITCHKRPIACFERA